MGNQNSNMSPKNKAFVGCGLNTCVLGSDKAHAGKARADVRVITTQEHAHKHSNKL